MQLGMVSTLGGGVGRQTAYLLSGLLRIQNLKINLYLVDRRSNTFTPNHGMYSLKYSPHSRFHLIAKIGALLKLSLRKYKEDIIHCHYASNAAFLRKVNSRLVLTLHGFPRPGIEINLADKMAYYFEHWCISTLSKKTKIITVSEYCRSAIKKTYGFDSQVIYNGVDLSYYRPSNNPLTIKNRLGLANNKIVLFVGRFHPMKNPLTLLKAFIEAKKNIANLILVMVGSGPLLGEMSNLSKNDPKVIFISRLDDKNLLELYQCADLFVLPSRGEPFGLVLTEAMACGCACIASNSGAFPEILGKKEMLFKADDDRSIKDLIIFHLENPTMAKESIHYLTRRVAENFSSDMMARSYLETYKTIA